MNLQIPLKKSWRWTGGGRGNILIEEEMAKTNEKFRNMLTDESKVDVCICDEIIDAI